MRAAATRDDGPIHVLGLEFGAYPGISSLNPRFVPGLERLKLTIDVLPDSHPFPGAADLLPALRQALPSLARHRCRDSEPLASTLGDPDAGANVAHLLEHVIIDLQHAIAAMSICSGVTCGYASPPHRYDLFIESPGHDVSRLAVALALDLMDAALSGIPVDPVCAEAARMARRICARPDAPLCPRGGAREAHDRSLAARALRVLLDRGFIDRVATCIDFSGMPLYRLRGSRVLT